MERVAVTIGADPEIFVADDEGVVPADLILPAQHEVGRDWKRNEEGKYLVYRDGMQAEIGVGPSNTNGPLVRAVQGALREISELGEQAGLHLMCEPCVPITIDSLMKARDPMSTQFGCAPERIARHGGANNVIDLDGTVHMVRYAGGHYHIGDMNPKADVTENPLSFVLRHPMGRLETVQCLDLILGNTLVLLEREADKNRREAYGLAGTYRETRYGLEYRTPSNLVIRHPAIFSLGIALTKLAVTVAANDARTKLFRADTDAVIQAIDQCDKDAAHNTYLSIRGSILNSGADDITREGLALIEYVFANGTDAVFGDDLSKSWNLESNEMPTVSWTDFANALRETSKDFASFEKAWKV